MPNSNCLPFGKFSRTKKRRTTMTTFLTVFRTFDTWAVLYELNFTVIETEPQASLHWRDIAIRKYLHIHCQLSLLQDILHPLLNFRNPCWREKMLDPAIPLSHNSYCGYRKSACAELRERYKKQFAEGIRSRLRCLPYFYFVGVTKSGTTDLKFQLNKHEHIEEPLLSEINWWNRRRQGEL